MRSIATRIMTTPGEQAGPLPLSPAQEGLWFMQRLAPLSIAYHLARVFHLRGQADISALEQALNVVRARQAVLRTRFAEQDGKPVQMNRCTGRCAVATDRSFFASSRCTRRSAGRSACS